MSLGETVELSCFCFIQQALSKGALICLVTSAKPSFLNFQAQQKIDYQLEKSFAYVKCAAVTPHQIRKLGVEFVSVHLTPQ